jgi:hypothetical protein
VVLGKGQLNCGTFRHFEVFCGEAQRIGGDDLYPSPMTYMAMGVRF